MARYIVRQVIIVVLIAALVSAGAWLLSGEHQPSAVYGALIGASLVGLYRILNRFSKETM